MKTCSCGAILQEDWMKTCKSCYAKQNKSKQVVSKEIEIRRQVFLKVAANQMRSASPKEIIGYAKELEAEFCLWK